MTAAARRKIVLAAGGTGGHMFPARALARELLARGLSPILITDKRAGGFGPDLADQVTTYHIAATGYAGTDILAKLSSLAQAGRGYLAARRILRRERPEAVVGFGGYAALPTCIAATHKRVRLIIHEQNAVMGRANRFVAPDAHAIATSFPEVRGLRAPQHDKVVDTGNPVHSSFVDVGRTPYAVADGEGPLRLLVTGGSQGARVFNELIPKAVGLLPAHMRRRLMVGQQVRGTDFQRVRELYADTGAEVELRSFFDDLPERLKRVHLVIARAGASTVTELAAAGRPAILVPYPFAADDHQAANAAAVEAAGAGWMLRQDDLTPERLSETIVGLFDEPARLRKAAEAARGFTQPRSAARLADMALGETNGAGGDDGVKPAKEAAA